MPAKLKLENCKCSAPPQPMQKVKGLTNGFVVRCSSPLCPAVTQSIGKTRVAERWNEVATK